MRPPQICSLADRPDLIPVVGRWHWDEWGHEDPGGSLAGWTEAVGRRSGRTWAALVGGEPVGSVTLSEDESHRHPDYRPRLAFLFVVPEQRAAGIGSALIAHCETAAAGLGVRVLHLYTTIEGYYARRGWNVVERTAEVAVMAKELATPR